MEFDQLFWGGLIGLITYIVSTILYVLAKRGDRMLYYTLILAVISISIFVGSKIGRSFLGCA